MPPAKKEYYRFTRFGFNIKVPADLQTPNNPNLLPFLDASLTTTQSFWCPHIKNVSFIPCGTTTAVLIRSSKQTYLKKWTQIARTMFTDWSKTLGEEAICEPSDEESKRVSVMFREFERGNNPLVHHFWRKTNHSVEIRQPSPLPGMVADALSKAYASDTLGDWGGVGSVLRAAKPIATLRNLPMLPSPDSLAVPGTCTIGMPVFTSSLIPDSQVLSPKSQQAGESASTAPTVPNAPRKRRAEEAEQPPAKRLVENPFKLKPNHLEEVKRFLLSAKPWKEPSKYREMTESDDPIAYRHDKKAHENKLPAIAVALTHLIPPITRRSACQSHLLTIDLPHTDTLTKIYNLLHCKGYTWNGVYALLQWPNMHFQTYGFNTEKPHYPSLNPIESHRRILKIEAAIQEMVDYLASAITAGSQSLRSIAPMDLAEAVVVLSASKPDVVDLILKILPQSYKLACPLSVQLDWLESNRARSLTHHTPFLTELGWGLGLLALLFSLRGSMDKLEDPEEAGSVLTSLMAFIDRRTFVFAKDMEPALLYGARLTKYAMDVRQLCEKFNGLGKVPLTTAGKFHELDVRGRLVGSDGMIIQLGLEAAPAAIAARILPFPMECDSLKTDWNLETTCADLISEERQLINAMLSDLDIDPLDCPALAIATAGQANIHSLLSTDSHTLNKTAVLAPSASLPGAWFEPAVVFGV